MKTPRQDPYATNEDIELAALLEAVQIKYGYDFRSYSRVSIKRRVMERLAKSSLPDISSLQHRVIHEPAFFEKLLQDFSINVTEMFRDPLFFLCLREKLIPCLSGMDQIKIWHAGCSSGEEVYSMAILLLESGIYNKCRLFATDFNGKILEAARDGIYHVKQIRQATRNYILAGGTGSFSDYYTARYDYALMTPSLRENMLFSTHNLVSDHPFGEMDIILCRNVLIYFNRELQNRVCDLLSRSLVGQGFLCLGSKESIRFAGCAEAFEDLDARHRIYRKKQNE